MNTHLKKSLVVILGSFLFFFSWLNGDALAQTTYTPPSQSMTVLKDIPFSQAVPVDETYRKEFEKCDKNNTFRGFSLPQIRRCKDDPNNVKALLKFPDGTFFYESKMSLDRDGSFIACKGNKRLSDLCSTSLPWPNISQEPDKYIDSDNFPYIVNPVVNFQPNDTSGNNLFEKKTGVKLGDIGVVIYKDKVVPVFIADNGPYNKLGEGSARVHELIGEDKCKTDKRRTDGKTRPDIEKRWTSDTFCEDHHVISVKDKVLFFIFPNSKIPNLSPSNAITKINTEALKRFANLKDNRNAVIKLDQPLSGQSFPLNTPVTFSGTAKPEVTKIKATIGPGGPFAIAELSDVAGTWTFTKTFLNTGKDRPVTLQPFNSQNQPLKDLTFTITIE